MKVICYGDSNTYGYDPRSWFGDRYEKDSRWVDILAAKTGWDVQNSGMNGREIPRRPISIPEDTDLVILMLGTNDLLQGNSAGQTARRMELFLAGLEHETVLLVAPPPMKLGEWVPSRTLVEESGRLAPAYREIAEKTGIRFADAGTWDVPLAYDGVHFTEEGHRRFAKGLYRVLTDQSFRRNSP